MARPQSTEDKEVLRLIKQSEYYNSKTRKWTSNKEAREWIASKLMVSNETVFRTLRRLNENGYLEKTNYRGIYYIKN